MRVLGLTIPGAFSGADVAIFDGLRARGLLAGVAACEIPLATRLSLLALTFRPNKRAWGNAWRGALYKTEFAFSARSAANDRVLRKQLSRFDIVLQMSGLFAPFVGEQPKPFAIFCDYTTKLAERNYPEWFGLSQNKALNWYVLETGLYERADIVLTASENTRRSIIDDYGIAPTRVRVVGEGIREVPDCTGKRYDQGSIVFIGIDFDRKGGPWLLEAFERVRTRIPNAQLHIVGPAPRKAQPGVMWHGHVSDRSVMKELLATATVLTLPSVCEPFGLALIEGMAHRLPVVGTQVDAMAEIVDDGLTGYLVPARDSVALADRFVDLLASPLLCEQFGTQAQQIVREKFLWSQVVDRTVDALSEALAPRTSTGSC